MRVVVVVVVKFKTCFSFLFLQAKMKWANSFAAKTNSIFLDYIYYMYLYHRGPKQQWTKISPGTTNQFHTRKQCGFQRSVPNGEYVTATMIVGCVHSTPKIIGSFQLVKDFVCEMWKSTLYSSITRSLSTYLVLTQCQDGGWSPLRCIGRLKDRRARHHVW